MFKLFHKDHPVPKWMQLAFTLAVSATFLINIIYTLILMYQQSFTNTNYSAFVGILASQSAMPLLMFAIAYYLNPRKLHPGERVFESLLLAITGLLTAGVVMQLLSYIGVSGGEQFIAFMIVTGAITVVVYAAALWQLRASKRWK
jgi:hypothetical protein